MNYNKLKTTLSFVLRTAHKDLAAADGPRYQADPGDPRAIEILLKFLSEELGNDVHFDSTTKHLENPNPGFSDGLIYAADILAGYHPSSFDSDFD